MDLPRKIGKDRSNHLHRKYTGFPPCGASTQVFNHAVRSTGSTDCVEHGLISLLHWEFVNTAAFWPVQCGTRVNVIVALPIPAFDRAGVAPCVARVAASNNIMTTFLSTHLGSTIYLPLRAYF